LETRTKDLLVETLELPYRIGDGCYQIKAVLTCSNDSKPGNNENYSTLVCIRPVPDLAVQSVKAAPGTYAPGDVLLVSAVVRNIGDQGSGAYTARYYLSTDATITAQDQSLGEVSRAGLAVGEQDDHQVPCQLPSYVRAGDSHVGVIITCVDDGTPENDVGCDQTPVTFIHPPGYVCGRVTYSDTLGRVHPVRYARVKIYDTRGTSSRLMIR
jgi:hypothetical protein